MTEQETGKRLMRLFLVTPVRVSAGPPLVSRSWCRVAVPFPLPRSYSSWALTSCKTLPLRSKLTFPDY